MWANISQATWLATFVRTGILTKEQGAQMILGNMPALCEGLSDLVAWQKAVQKANKWLHPEEDHSGSVGDE